MIKTVLSVALGFAILMITSVVSEAKALKIATIAPEGSTWMKIMREGAEEIKERTQGRVRIKFYTGGVMGNEKSVLRKIRIKQLHGGAFTGGGLAGVYPGMHLYSLPMEFQSFDELDYVRSRMDDTLKKGLNDAGFISFGFTEGGFAKAMSKVPVRTLNDLKGKKIWVPEGDVVSYSVMGSLGLSPVTLPITDVMTGLETGLIDVIASPAIGAIAFQWHTKLEYITDARLSYVFGTLVMDRSAFSRIKPEDQSIVREVMENANKVLDQQSRKDGIEAEKALIAQGLILVRQSPKQLNEWRVVARPAIEALFSDGTLSRELYDEMQSYVTEFRARTDRGKRQAAK